MEEERERGREGERGAIIGMEQHPRNNTSEHFSVAYIGLANVCLNVCPCLPDVCLYMGVYLLPCVRGIVSDRVYPTMSDMFLLRPQSGRDVIM